jgi:uncharacterized protein with FMN-binding domain
MRKAISLLLMAGLMLPLMASCTARADQRTGEAEGYGGPLKVSVTMDGEDITRVEVTEHNETQGVGTRAIEALPAAIEEADSIDVDSVSGATITSEAIKQAVSQAMGMAGIIQQVIPMDGVSATEAAPINALRGVGMAATGRVGPGKDEDGNQVYSYNVVFAAGEFDQGGAIRSMQIDQLEVVTPNLGGGSAFSGFPGSVAEEEAFMNEVSAWQTKGMMGNNYMLPSGSWRTQMDELQQQMMGKTVAEVREWAASRVPTAGESADTTTTATISLQGEYGDVVLAIERAWADAQRGQEGTKVDTNTVTDATDGGENMG